MMNKNGFLISAWWFFVLVIVAVAVVTAVVSYYGTDTDVRTTESQMLNNYIYDCLSRYQVTQDNIYSVCNLNKQSFNPSGEFFFLIDSDGVIIKGGNVGYEGDCKALKDVKAERYSKCSFNTYEISGVKTAITTASNQVGGRDE